MTDVHYKCEYWFRDNYLNLYFIFIKKTHFNTVALCEYSEAYRQLKKIKHSGRNQISVKCIPIEKCLQYFLYSTK